ncbi:MAG: peroxiredoxin [Chromatiales bacterium]|nr:peroxiredoxin [Chromatiales bacterium]
MSVLVGHKAPGFTAPAVLGDGSIVEDFDFIDFTANKYVVLFFYPLDFTFVCPSELIAFNRRFDDFQARDAQVIGISVDSHYTHNAWRNTPIDNGGIGSVRYPLVADLTHWICKSYDVEAMGGDVALRGSFLIDRDGIVRHQVVNDLPLGRNIDEMIRMLDALQFHEINGEVCPAGWHHGNAGMKDTPEGVADYLRQHAEAL